MTQSISIFELDRSVEDERPVIDFDAKINQGVDWKKLDDILRGQRPISDYDEVQISIPSPEASSWGFYSVPGTLGLMSATAIERIGNSVFRLYNLLPARLNEARYFFLQPNEVLACLDREKSDIITFRSNPGRVKEIKKYVFKKDLIADPIIFSIPESLSRLYTTTTVCDIIARSSIPGFRFIPLD